MIRTGKTTQAHEVIFALSVFVDSDFFIIVSRVSIPWGDKEVYAFVQQQPGAAHIATSGTHTDAGNGPARFTKYAQNAKGSRIVSMLETVMLPRSEMPPLKITQGVTRRDP